MKVIFITILKVAREGKASLLNLLILSAYGGELCQDLL